MAASEGRSRVIRSIRLHLIFSDASVSFFALVSFFFCIERGATTPFLLGRLDRAVKCFRPRNLIVIHWPPSKMFFSAIFLHSGASRFANKLSRHFDCRRRSSRLAAASDFNERSTV